MTAKKLAIHQLVHLSVELDRAVQEAPGKNEDEKLQKITVKAVAALSTLEATPFAVRKERSFYQRFIGHDEQDAKREFPHFLVALTTTARLFKEAAACPETAEKKLPKDFAVVCDQLVSRFEKLQKRMYANEKSEMALESLQEEKSRYFSIRAQQAIFLASSRNDVLEEYLPMLAEDIALQLAQIEKIKDPIVRRDAEEALQEKAKNKLHEAFQQFQEAVISKMKAATTLQEHNQVLIDLRSRLQVLFRNIDAVPYEWFVGVFHREKIQFEKAIKPVELECYSTLIEKQVMPELDAFLEETKKIEDLKLLQAKKDELEMIAQSYQKTVAHIKCPPDNPSCKPLELMYEVIQRANRGIDQIGDRIVLLQERSKEPVVEDSTTILGMKVSDTTISVLQFSASAVTSAIDYYEASGSSLPIAIGSSLVFTAAPMAASYVGEFVNGKTLSRLSQSLIEFGVNTGIWYSGESWVERLAGRSAPRQEKAKERNCMETIYGLMSRIPVFSIFSFVTSLCGSRKIKKMK